LASVHLYLSVRIDYTHTMSVKIALLIGPFVLVYGSLIALDALNATPVLTVAVAAMAIAIAGAAFGAFWEVPAEPPRRVRSRRSPRRP
jgi:hypothetical protein